MLVTAVVQDQSYLIGFAALVSSPRWQYVGKTNWDGTVTTTRMLECGVFVARMGSLEIRARLDLGARRDPRELGASLELAWASIKAPLVYDIETQVTLVTGLEVRNRPGIKAHDIVLHNLPTVPSYIGVCFVRISLIFIIKSNFLLDKKQKAM